MKLHLLLLVVCGVALSTTVTPPKIVLTDDAGACTQQKAGNAVTSNCDIVITGSSVTTEGSSVSFATVAQGVEDIQKQLQDFQVCPISYGLNDVTNKCERCAVGDSFNGRIDHKECAPASKTLQCHEGFGLVDATARSDFKCEACTGGGAGGTYSDVHDRTACKPVSHTKTCAEGSGQVEATSIADTTCELCSIEDPNPTWSSTAGTDACNPTDKNNRKSCAKGQGWRYSRSHTDGYKCVACTTGTSHATNTWTDATGTDQCKPTLAGGMNCPAGQGWVYSNEHTNGYKCAGCVPGVTYSDVTDNSQCQGVGTKPTCGKGSGVVADVTGTNGWRCSPCSDTAPRTYSATEDSSSCQSTPSGGKQCAKGQGWEYSTSATGGYTCEACVLGEEYSHQNNNEQCQTAVKPVCPVGEGYEADNKILNGYKCVNCVAGTSWSTTNDATPCQPLGATRPFCIAGKGWVYSVEHNTGYKCESCLQGQNANNRGSWSDANDQEQCTPTGTTEAQCEAGKGWEYSKTANTGYTCEDCEAGTSWSAANDRSQCAETCTSNNCRQTCTSGSGWQYSNSHSNGYQCMACTIGTSSTNRGTYSNGNDKNQCQGCPSRTIASTGGASQCSDNWSAKIAGQGCDEWGWYSEGTTESQGKQYCKDDSSCNALKTMTENYSYETRGRRRRYRTATASRTRYGPCASTARCDHRALYDTRGRRRRYTREWQCTSGLGPYTSVDYWTIQ